MIFHIFSHNHFLKFLQFSILDPHTFSCSYIKSNVNNSQQNSHLIFTDSSFFILLSSFFSKFFIFFDYCIE